MNSSHATLKCESKDLCPECNAPVIVKEWKVDENWREEIGCDYASFHYDESAVRELVEALEEVKDYFNWEREAFRNSWCQDGSRRLWIEERVSAVLTRHAQKDGGKG